jgi:hypothetical protein
MSSDDQTSAQTNETSLDVNVLKEIGKKALVDALNSVCYYHKLRNSSEVEPWSG